MIGPGSMLPLHDLRHGEDIDKELGIGLHTQLAQNDWVQYRGIRYKPGCVILHSVDKQSGLSCFMQVTYILSYDCNLIWFVGCCLQAAAFDSHFHGWLSSEKWLIKLVSVKLQNLSYTFPATFFQKPGDSDTNILLGIKYLL
jgi:hypothetical protein